MSAPFSSYGWSVIGVGAFLACATPVSPQELKPLSPLSAVTISSEASGPLLDPIRCDSLGNLFLRRYTTSPTAAPILMISADGRRSITFDVRRVPEFGRAALVEFDVAADGRVFALAARGRDEVHIVRFSNDGRFESDTRLEPPFPFLPLQIAVFSPDRFLVAGFRIARSPETRGGEPFTGIFDNSGRLVAKLELPGDYSPGETSVSRKSGEQLEVPRDEATEPDPIAAVSLGSAVTSESGVAYLMRKTSPTLVYAISANGEVLKRLLIRSALEGAFPETLKESHGTLLIPFVKPNANGPGTYIFSAVNPETGETTANYSSEGDLGPRLGCFKDGRLTFLVVREKKFALLQAIAP